MNGLFLTTLSLVLAPALGKPVWSSIHSEGYERRLAIQLTTTTNDTQDASCLVGGFDDVDFAKLYIGGPCSQFNFTTTSPMSNFRYVAMKTVHLALADANGSETHLVNDNSGDFPIMHSKDETTHAEVGLCGLFRFDADAGIEEAGYFASTTSYLAKANISTTTNSFVIGKTGNDYKRFDTCIQSCCTEVTGAGCACSSGSCPTNALTYSAGDFKYSILAAAYDKVDNSTKGWAKARDLYGLGTPKVLTGYTHVYQIIDFTNMGADSITITHTDASSTTYANMQACNISKMQNCASSSVKNLTLAASGWEGVSYTFPQYMNRGQWTTSATGVTTSSPLDSKVVVIEAVKFDDASLQSMLGGDYTGAGMKILAIRYKFDITGVDATGTTGKYFVYDPTVNTVSRAQARAAASAASAASGGGSAGGTTASSAQTGSVDSDARTSTPLTLLTALVAAVNFLK